MASSLESDYYLQRVVRSTLLRNPAASYDDALAAWMAHSGEPLDASASERVLAAFEAEQPGRKTRDELKRRPRHGFWERSLLYVGVGALPVFALASALFGPGNVLGVLAFAAVCTAGAGLAPVVLIAWVAGWVIVNIYRAVTSG